MQILLDILTLIVDIAMIGIGYLCLKEARKLYINQRQKPLEVEELGKIFRRVHDLEEIQSKPENYGEAGIVYRPTVEEIEKMNEPQAIKEAKEAVAETLAKEIPPKI